jgi:hypothetical protein
MTMWARWVRQPQRIWLRRALFQVHLWSGIAIGLYIFMISVTGSVLVYRNELFVASPRVMRATFWLLDLHDNLLAGETGRRSQRRGRVRDSRPCRDRIRDLVAGNQNVASKSDAASWTGMAADVLAPAQHDRVLDLRVHGLCSR